MTTISTSRSTGSASGRRRAPARAVAGSVLVLGLSVGLSACTGSSGSAGPTPSSGTGPTSAAVPGGGGSSAAPSPSTTGSSRSSATSTPSGAKTTPTAGSTSQTVPPRTQQTSKPVKIKKKSSFGGSVSARITSMSSRYVKAKLPGQTSGDSVVFTVEIDNGSSATIDLNSTVVTVTDSAGDPTNQITTAPATRIPNTVKPGGAAKATYVFVVPKAKRKPITVDVTISADLDVVVFKGNAA